MYGKIIHSFCQLPKVECVYVCEFKKGKNPNNLHTLLPTILSSLTHPLPTPPS